MTRLQQPSNWETVPKEMPECSGEIIRVNGLSRREVVALLSSVAMGLVGCSSTPSTGSGTPPPPPPPPPPPAGLSQVAVTVSLPSGSGLSPSTLSLQVMEQAIGLTTAATLSASVSPNAPTLAIVADANGNGVMAGFLDSTLTGAQAITPRSTGVVLTWFALGGPFLPANVKSQVLGLLSADPTMDTLGGVIAQRIAAAPLAVVNADAQVSAALNRAVAALTAAPAGSIGGAAHLANGTPSMVTVMSVPNDGSGPSTQTTQGGVNVQPDNTIAGVDIANFFRRPVRAYVYETQTSTAGVVTDISPATLFAGPFDLGAPAAFAAPSTLQQLMNQPAPYQAFTINPIALVLDGSSDQTTYEVVVIGPSSSGVIPPFFSAARYANEAAGWTTAINSLFGQVIYSDLVYALLLEMTGFASIQPTSAQLATAAANARLFAGNPFATVTGGGSATRPALPSSAQTFVSAMNTGFHALTTNGALSAQYQVVAPTIMAQAEAAALQQLSSVSFQTRVQTGSNLLLKLASPFSVTQANGALGKLLANLSNTDAGLLWQVTAGEAKVTITPPNPTVVPGGMTPLTVVLSADLTGTYEFDWSSSSFDATFSAVGESNVGAAINTQQMTVNLITTATDVDPIVVTLAVYELTPGHRAFLTSVTTTVTLLQQSTITPAPAILNVGDQKTFTVTVSGTLPAGVKYVWSVVGGSGSIGTTSPVTTTVPQITYTAQQKGTDTLSVQVFDATNHLLSNTSAVIRVNPDPFVDFTISGNWGTAFAGGPPNGHYVFTTFGGTRFVDGSTGLDAVFLEYDLGSSEVGVLVGLFVPTGQAISTGEAFSHRVPGHPATAGTFELVLSSDFNNVDTSGSVSVPGTGSLTIDLLSQLTNGTFVAQYSFNIDNGAGGKISGSGLGQWT